MIQPGPALVVEDLVSALNAPDQGPEAAFAALLTAIHTRRFTGTLVLHFQNGTPRQADFPQPLRVKLSA